ncbi:MAG TPA: hypothetical protein VHE30_07895 [Polyangiaceae bacterium]|nr:hypothetical protein [Polyangiaceae bacterium]
MTDEKNTAQGDGEADENRIATTIERAEQIRRYVDGVLRSQDGGPPIFAQDHERIDALWDALNPVGTTPETVVEKAEQFIGLLNRALHDVRRETSTVPAMARTLKDSPLLAAVDLADLEELIAEWQGVPKVSPLGRRPSGERTWHAILADLMRRARVDGVSNSKDLADQLRARAATRPISFLTWPIDVLESYARPARERDEALRAFLDQLVSDGILKKE